MSKQTKHELAMQWLEKVDRGCYCEVGEGHHALECTDVAVRHVENMCAEVRELRAALERARALLPADLIECVTKPGRGYTECGCGRDHCSYCLYTKWEHDLAALLGSGGAA